MTGKAIVTLAGAFAISVLQSEASAARLPDGTPVRVRLLNVIISETSMIGQPLEFVVARDVVAADRIVIKRGTIVTGTIVEARRLRLGLITRPGRLAFRFDRTTAMNGQPIALRSARVAEANGHVVVDRLGLHHYMQWADGADLFDAFVEGDYDVP